MWQDLHLYHTILAHDDPAKEAFLKHCEKMLKTSIFSFSHYAYCYAFNLEACKIFILNVRKIMIALLQRKN